MSNNRLKYGFLLLVWCLVIYGFVSVSGSLVETRVRIDFSLYELVLPAAGFLLLFVASILMRAMRWWYMIKSEVALPAQKCLLYFCWIFLVKMFTPLRAGEFFRALWIKRYGGSAAFVAGTVLAERVLDLAVLMLIIFACALFADMAGDLARDTAGMGEQAMALAWLMLAGLLLGLALIFLLNRLLGRIDTASLAEGLKKNLLAAFQQVLHAFRVLTAKSQFLPVALASVLAWALVAAAYQLVLSSLVPGLPVYSGALVILAVNLAGFVSATPGNIGAYEFAGVLVLTTLHAVQAQDALVAVVILHVLQISGAMLAGMLSRILLRKDFDSLLSFH